MPIGDLLAQITGQKSAPSPTTTASPLPRANTLPKRKPDGDLRNDPPKAPRTPTTAAAGRSTQPSRPIERSNSLNTKPSSDALRKPQSLSSRPLSSANRVSKPSSNGRPGPVARSANGGPQQPEKTPKPGSFAAIMARANQAQASMGHVGRIQHKKVEGGLIKKEKEARMEQKSQPPPRQRPVGGSRGYSGSAAKNAPARGNALPSKGRPQPQPSKTRNATGSGSGSAKGATTSEEEQEKKIRKAAQFNSGYTGTARGKPPVSTKSKRDAPRGGALLNVPKPRPGASRNSRYEEDDYDEELDDFIDYDDEEDDAGGPRYEYASDGSSDMEAGMDDVFEEEQRAERIARKEDLEEARLEESLKREKDKRRRALEELRAKRR